LPSPCCHRLRIADPTGFLGLSFSFGNNQLSTGVSARLLSNDVSTEWAAGAGVSYYFTGETGVGVDLGVARNFTNSAGFVGYDFLRNQPVVSFGVTRTQDASTESSDPGFVSTIDPPPAPPV
jgi:hypothetical protein